MTTTIEPTTVTVPGWHRPEWATETRYDEGGLVIFVREPQVQPLQIVGSPYDDGEQRIEPAAIELTREDVTTVDGDSGQISIQIGVPRLHLGEMEDLPADQMPALVAAVQELLDAFAAPDKEN
jgi:hypothetical protein